MRTLTTKDGRTFIAAEIEDLTGSIEVTVWPETYEMTRDHWHEGNIVVASVKVRDNNDRLQVAVQRVQLYEGPSFDPQALFAEPSTPSAPYRRNGGGNGRNGNGNGHAAPAVKPAQQRMRIIIDETDDPDGDSERLNAVISTLRGYSGADPVRLSVRQLNGQEIEMELPAARKCDELTRLLGDIVGPWGNVYA
jgi:DNA polymerase-3 subunit alpha